MVGAGGGCCSLELGSDTSCDDAAEAVRGASGGLASIVPSGTRPGGGTDTVGGRGRSEVLELGASADGEGSADAVGGGGGSNGLVVAGATDDESVAHTVGGGGSTD